MDRRHRPQLLVAIRPFTLSLALRVACAVACAVGSSCTGNADAPSPDVTPAEPSPSPAPNGGLPSEPAPAPPTPDVLPTPEPEPTPPPTNPACAGDQPAAAPSRLLTRSEYNHVVRDLFDDNSAPAESFPVENQALGFENNANAHLISPLLLDQLVIAAEAIAQRAFFERLAITAPCAPTAVQNGNATALRACGLEIIETLGRRVYRRPLSVEERSGLVTLLDDTLATDNLPEALSRVLQTMLLSPQFLYRTVTLTSGETPGAAMPLNGYEVASRLSFLLWASTPDTILLDAAAAGELSTRTQVIAQARRMIDDSKARDASEDFMRQWLQLDKLDHAEKVLPPGYPATSSQVTASLKQSMFAFTDHAVFDSPNSFAELFGSTKVALDQNIAGLFGQSATGLVNFPATERSGLLTQPGFLATFAHADQSSPIHRGIFVRDRLLCQPLPPPPPDLIVTPPSADPNATTRERFSQHTQETLCQGCHILIDPIGFGFESYDALGRFRQEENGLPIDATGELLYTLSGDPQVEGPFDGAVELSEKLGRSDDVKACIASQYYRFAMGRGASAPADACNLAGIAEGFVQNGNIKELLVALASSDALRLRPSQTLETPPPFDEAAPSPSPSPSPVPSPSPAPSPSPTPPPNTAPPTGYIDGINASGAVHGWAYDPDSPVPNITVQFTVDAPLDQGGMLIGATLTGSSTRPDVDNVFGLNPGANSGWNFTLPASYHDGQPHTLYATAVDSDDNTVFGPLFPFNGFAFQVQP